MNKRRNARYTGMGIILALFLLTTPGFCQGKGGGDSTDTKVRAVRVTLTDGSEIIGTIQRQMQDSIQFRTVSGVSMAIPQRNVAEIDSLSGLVEGGRYRRVDPNRSRLFLSPTARPLRAGEGYVSDIMLFFPYLSVGVADFLSLGGGMTLFPGATAQLYYLAPKISIPVGGESVHLGAGVLYSNVTAGDFDGLGMAYGMVTAGSPFASVTLGVGKGFVAGGFAETYTIMLGGEAQISNSVALLTENWIPTGSDVQVISFGVRFFGEHLSADLGFFRIVTTGSGWDGFPFVPWLGFSYHFGN